MDIAKSLRYYLSQKGFCRELRSKTFYKLCRENYYVFVEIKKDKHPILVNNNGAISLPGIFYDMMLQVVFWSDDELSLLKQFIPSITKKKYFTNFDCEISLCALAGKKKQMWIVFNKGDKVRILNEIKDAFEKEFYSPLFDHKEFSMYDFLCHIDLMCNREVYYCSELLAKEALKEGRIQEALFCLRCCMVQKSELIQLIGTENPTTHESYTWEDLEPMLTDEMIHQLMKNGDVDAVSYIKQYNEIKSHIEKD